MTNLAVLLTLASKRPTPARSGQPRRWVGKHARTPLLPLITLGLAHDVAHTPAGWLGNELEVGRLGCAVVGQSDDQGSAATRPGPVGLPREGVPVGGRVVGQASGPGADALRGRVSRRGAA